MRHDCPITPVPEDRKRPRLRIVSSVKDEEKKVGELARFFGDFEEALMKEIEAILDL